MGLGEDLTPCFLHFPYVATLNLVCPGTLRLGFSGKPKNSLDWGRESWVSQN